MQKGGLKINSKPILDIRNLGLSFVQNNIKTDILEDISLQVPPNATVGIVGESGSGKSVLSHTVMGLLPSYAKVSGEVIFNSNNSSTNLLTLSQYKLNQIRGKDINIIFQDPRSSLNPVISVGEQVAECLVYHNKISKKSAKNLVIESFSKLSIPRANEVYKSYPHNLSGGMCQRIMIAMSILLSPSLLIADEITTALDASVSAQIIALLSDLKQANRFSILFITHDLKLINDITDYLYVLYRGKVLEYGLTKSILKNQLHPYTKSLFLNHPAFGKKGSPLYVAGSGCDAENRFNTGGCVFYFGCKYRKDSCKQNAPKLKRVSTSHYSACPFTL